jgi:hypothetical protein
VIISFLWGFRVGALPRDFTGSFVGVIFRETSLGSLASELGSSENMWPVAFRLKDDGGDRNPVSKARQMCLPMNERTNERSVCLMMLCFTGGKGLTDSLSLDLDDNE